MVALEAFSLERVFRIVVRRRGTVAATAAATVAVALVATAAQRRAYVATSMLLIEARKPNVLDVRDPYELNPLGSSLVDYYRTQFELLRSRGLLEKVGEQLRLAERDEYRGAGDPIAAFAGRVLIDPVRESRLVRVSVESRDPAFATDAANAIVREFVNQTSQRTLGVSDAGLKRLQAMEAELGPARDCAQLALQRFKEQHGFFAADESQTTAARTVKTLADELTKVRAERARAAADHRAFAEAIRTAPPGRAGIARSKVAEELGLTLAKVEVEVDELGRRFGPAHPLVRPLAARRASLLEQLAAEERAVLERAGRDHAVALERELELERALAQAERHFAEVGRLAIQLQGLKAEAERAEASCASVSKRIGELTIALAAGTAESNMFVIDPARTPAAPIRPRKAVNLALGAFLGVVLGALGALARHAMDPVIHGADDVALLVGEAPLGVAPLVPRTRGAAELEARRAPRSAVAETFRGIRVALAERLHAESSRSLVVTSAVPGEGRTFVATNLAIAFARTGRRVLLVDADYHRPRIGAIFPIVYEGGLAAAIGGSPIDGAQATSVPTLQVLPAGALLRSPADALGSEAMVRFVAHALAAYELVVFDASALSTSEARSLVALVPHVVLVVRAGVSERVAVASAFEELQHGSARLLGTVVNAATGPDGPDGVSLRAARLWLARTWQAWRAPRPDVSRRAPHPAPVSKAEVTRTAHSTEPARPGPVPNAGARPT